MSGWLESLSRASFPGAGVERQDVQPAGFPALNVGHWGPLAAGTLGLVDIENAEQVDSGVVACPYLEDDNRSVIVSILAWKRAGLSRAHHLLGGKQNAPCRTSGPPPSAISQGARHNNW